MTPTLTDAQCRALRIMLADGGSTMIGNAFNEGEHTRSIPAATFRTLQRDGLAAKFQGHFKALISDAGRVAMLGDSAWCAPDPRRGSYTYERQTYYWHLSNGHAVRGK